MPALALVAPVATHAGTRGETKRRARRAHGASRVAIRGARRTPARIVSKRERDIVARDEADRSIDAQSPSNSRRALALGAATLGCLAAADPVAAKEVVLQVPELEFPTFDGLSFPDFSKPLELDPAAFARFTLSNPPAAVAASIAAYVVIPRAAKWLTKYVLIPAVVLAVLAAVAEDPAGGAAAASAAAKEASEHPTETSAVILALACLALSPYILLAALLALILSGAQLLPEKFPGNQLVPEPVRLANERVGRLQRAAEPGVRAARGAVDSARAATSDAATVVERRKAREDAAERAREEAARLRAREETTRRRAERTAGAIEEAEEVARAAAAAAAAAAAETASGAASTTRCASRETAVERARCVDEQRAARKEVEAARTRERRAQADRLRAESAKRAGAVPSLPGRGRPESDA